MRDIGPTDRASPNPRLVVTAGATPPPPPAPAPTVTPTPGVPAPAVQIAATLARLIEGGTITVVVVGRDAHGQTVVQSDTRGFVLTGAPPLPDQARLLLQLLGNGPAGQARILEVNGQPLRPAPEVILQLPPALAGAPALPVRPPAPNVALPAAVPAAPGAALPPGMPVAPNAVLPPAAPAAPGAAPHTAPPGSMSLPATPPARDFSPLIGKTVQAVVTAAAPPPPGPGAMLAPALPWLRQPMAPLGATLVLTLRAVESETAAPLMPVAAARGAATPLPAEGQTITGRVVGNLNGGQTLMHTAFATLKVAGMTAAPVGAAVTAEVVEWRLPPVVAAELTEPAVAALLRLRRDWPAMRDALGVLGEVAPDIALAWAARHAPRPDPRLASTLLRFMAALKEGRLDLWLDAAAQQALEGHGRSDLVRRLRDDFRQMAELADQRSEGDWRAVLLPLTDGRQLRMAAFYVRRRRRQAGDRDPGTRFILDLDLDVTGPLQFDGLVRPQQLDLMVRSANALPASWQRDIAAIFDQALGIGGYRGQVAFQAGARSLVSPADDLRRAAPAAAVTV